MGWHKIDFSLEDVMAKRAISVFDKFEELFMGAGGPKAAALFETDNVADGSVVYWFTPTASELANALIVANGGEPCSHPPAEGITLLIGHADARERYFPKPADEE